MNIPHLTTAAALAAALASGPALAAGTFTSLGSGKVYSISSDGSIIVGERSSTAAQWDTSTFTYTNLGLLGGDTKSVARDVSADGSVIVGASGTKIWDPNIGGENTSGMTTSGQYDDAQGVVWSGGGSPAALAGLTGSAGFSGAYGVSADGTTVVGTAAQNYNPWNAVANENGRADDLAYDPTRWNFNNDGTPKVTPDYDPTTYLNDQWRTGAIWDISGGVGSATATDIGKSPRFNFGLQHDPGFAPGAPLTGSGTPEDPWGSYNPTPTYLPPHPSYQDWFFNLPMVSVSGDGSRAVGWSQGPEGTHTAQYDEGVGTTSKGAANYGRSWVRRISDNGKYSVGGTWGDGAGGQDTNRSAFRYTQTAQWQQLPFLTPPAGGGQSDGYTEMFGVSENGWFAVGAGNKEVLVPPFFTANRKTAVIWDEINGTQELATFLADQGVTGYESWFLKRATDVIFDQNTNTLTIIGFGSPTGENTDTAAMSSFHIEVDGILSRDDYIGGDANLDGTVSIADFALLQNNFGGKGFWGQGDFNGDGVISIADFAILQNNFGAGAATVSEADLAAVAAFAATIPEPASLALLALGGLGALARPHPRKNTHNISTEKTFH